MRFAFYVEALCPPEKPPMIGNASLARVVHRKNPGQREA